MGELSQMIGVTRHTIARYEAGQFIPTPEHLKAMSKALKFPERFFHRDDIGSITEQAASFRSGINLPARMRDMALGSAAVAIAFNREAERFFALPQAKLPDYSDRQPDRAADLMRGRWDLGSHAVGPLLPLMEEKGTRIFSLPSDLAIVDTFSLWHGDVPFIFLNAAKTSDARRADLAYELGHLVLHRVAPPGSKLAHEEAKTFVEAFLLPADAMRKCGDVSAESQVTHVAAQFGVPPIMVARRLHRLGLMSEWKFRALRTALEQFTRRDHDRISDRTEASSLFPRIFASLHARGITKRKLATILSIYPNDLEKLVFCSTYITAHKRLPERPIVASLPPRLSLVSK